MKKLTTLLVLFTLVFAACKNEEKETKAPQLTIGDLVFEADYLQPGETVNLIYNGTGEDIEGHYYFMVNNKTYPVDIDLSADHKATIKIPDSAQALAFNIKVDGTYDNNNTKGYLVQLTDTEGNVLPGSMAALANYTMMYGSDFGITSDKDELFNDIKNDVTNNPEIQDNWNPTYLGLAYRQDKATGEQLINDYITTVSAKENKTEEDYTTLVRMYNTIGNREQVEAITEEVKEKYPNGIMAKNSYGNRFSQAKDLAEKETIFEEFNSKYNDLGNVGNYMVRSLAMAYQEQGNTEKFDLYTGMIKDKAERAGLLNSIAWPLAEKGENLDFAATTSKASLDLMASAVTNSDKKPDYYTESQYEKSLKSSYNMYADTYALILFKQGNVKEAITYQEKAVDEGKNGEMNERYIEFLMADEQYDVVQEKSEEFIEEGNGSEKIKELYKVAFMKNTPDADAFETKLAALEKIAHETYTEEIKKTMINQEAPTFTLKNTKGEDVSLASLRGKTVILDFWATWCGPCKASFPGMQQVVTKYQDDENVVLLFVDTFESGDDREQLVTNFIAKNDYDFHVIYDNEVENSNSFEVAEKYGISGIPTKIIIDKEGKIRFKAVGYSGQTEKLVNEMDIMIEILKS